MINNQPLYVIKIDDGYYNGDKPWKKVTKEEATKLTHKNARRIRGKLKRLRYAASVEPLFD